jgi:phage N-6-adenine-methyltransferase
MLPESNVRETPPDLFTELSRIHGPFTLDACASHQNAKCDRYYTEAGLWLKRGPLELAEPECLFMNTDGLKGTWHGYRVWCNPPYSDIGAWLMKAWDSDAESVTMLVPATRTEQDWWQDGVEPFRDQDVGAYSDWDLPGKWSSFSLAFLRGRQHFLEDGHPIWRKNKDGSLWLNKKGQPQRSSPKFGCCTLTWS